jgi:hypothetical protein
MMLPARGRYGQCSIVRSAERHSDMIVPVKVRLDIYDTILQATNDWMVRMTNAINNEGMRSKTHRLRTDVISY